MGQYWASNSLFNNNFVSYSSTVLWENWRFLQTLSEIHLLWAKRATKKHSNFLGFFTSMFAIKVPKVEKGRKYIMIKVFTALVDLLLLYSFFIILTYIFPP